ncbi:helix-turn-helix transcriptional regulator [Halomicrobium urmianum]|uniref:helix-turn-helix transcriptional regulator n=1 Tax=Halomicrobium urmianum TaxID=1586233 RepID=UPI001CDA4A15|nr:helix-turn-helix domain-containing protein [Halomicrobium urmianum]
MNGSGDGDGSPPQVIDFLAASEHRIETLRVLVEQGTVTRRDVRSEVDASRSTVRRTLEGFLERGWVESTTDGYRITPAGELMVDVFGQFVERVERVETYTPLLRWLPPSALDVDLAWLEGGTLTVATEADPYAPAQTQTETVRTAERFRGFLPAIERDGTELVHDRITAGELTASIVVSPAVSETVRSDPFEELLREQLATGRLDVFVSPDPLPYYLGLPDEDGVEIGGMDDDGIPRALLQSTNDDLRRWGEETFESARADAERLTEGDL